MTVLSAFGSKRRSTPCEPCATVTRNNKLVETSGVLGNFESENQAQLVGLDWCRAWVDSHG
ncbi:protein of unknown function [Paraburkholderia kururiensis]